MIGRKPKWGVEQAIEETNALAEFNRWWMEEPTNPDDVLGTRAHPAEVGPSALPTGEHCQNRIIFKQLMQAEAIDVCQINSRRLAGVNENLAVILMAAKFGIPVAFMPGELDFANMFSTCPCLTTYRFPALSKTV